MEKITLYTHDGTAHADDSFAAAILSIVYPGALVVRTRDPTTLGEALDKPGSFFLDVGGVYDASNNQFDHHQPAGAGFRDGPRKEWPYATAGLVWKHYGAQAVANLQPGLDSDGVQEVVQYIDDSVLRYIDAVDCGVRLKSAGPSLSALIACFNPSWYEDTADVFALVMALSQEVLTNFVKRFSGKVLARTKVRLSQKLFNGQLLVLDTCLPWNEVVAAEMPDVLLVTYPVGDVWRPQWQIRTADDTRKTPRLQLPQSWAGYERSALGEITGEPTATFCHRSRHLAGATSFDGALNLAQSALKYHHAQACLALD